MRTNSVNIRKQFLKYIAIFNKITAVFCYGENIIYIYIYMSIYTYIYIYIYNFACQLKYIFIVHKVFEILKRFIAFTNNNVIINVE